MMIVIELMVNYYYQNVNIYCWNESPQTFYKHGFERTQVLSGNYSKIIFITFKCVSLPKTVKNDFNLKMKYLSCCYLFLQLFAIKKIK